MQRFFVPIAVALTAAAFAFVPRASATSISTGVVDVTTNLAYQNGSAAGTGMALTSSGEVLTNNHVIRGATTIRVTDPSTGRSYSANVVGYSVTSDVAILQVTGASNLHTVKLGNSAIVKVGQRVTAVGNAGGAGGKPSASTGKVTAVNRTIVATDGELSEQLNGLIQVDANLQPGDSGGPLLNAAGRVIGMNTAGSAGFYFRAATEGYAIPINRAIALAKQIVAKHSSATVHIGSTPFLGVSVSTSPNGQGVLIESVVSGSPADQAGIVAGDVITSVDGTAVGSYGTLSAALLRDNAGASVALTWIDQTGATQSASVTTVPGPPQ